MMRWPAFLSGPTKEKRVVVLSNSLDNVRNEAELYIGAVEGVLSTLQSDGVKHIWVDEGVTVSRFIEAGLVDSITVSLIPVILGRGVRLFNSMDQEYSCRLISADSYP